MEEERLEMDRYLVGGGQERYSYRLCASHSYLCSRAFGLGLTPHARADGVTNHMGTLNGGHYTAFARNAGDNQWYSFNDERVNRISGREVAGPEAYVLYYERMDQDGQPY